MEKDAIFSCFEGSPVEIMKVLDGMLREKGIPFDYDGQLRLVLPKDGLRIELEAIDRGETAVRFLLDDLDGVPLARRLDEQLSKWFVRVAQEMPQKAIHKQYVWRYDRLIALIVGLFICVAIASSSVIYYFNQPPPLVWTYDVDGDVFSRPIVTDELVLFGTMGEEDGRFFAVNRTNGDLEWDVTFGDTNIFYWAESLTSNGLALFSTDAGYFYGLDAQTGVEAWVFTPEQRGLDLQAECIYCTRKFRQPLLRDDVVYLPSHDHHLYALDGTNGRELWRFEGENTFLGQPQLSGDLVFASNTDGNVYILDAQTGDLVDNVSIGSAIFEIMIDEVHIYVVLEGGILRAYDRADYSLEWQIKDNSMVGFSSRIVVEEDFVLTMNPDQLFAFDKLSGQPMWDFSGFSRGVYWDYTVKDGRLYVGDGDSYLHVFDIQSGQLIENPRMTLHDLGSRDFTSDPVFAPAIAEDVAYFGWSGQLYAIELLPAE